MAFNPKYLTGNVGAGGTAPLVLTYLTEDTIATVSAADYFATLTPAIELTIGDSITCNCADGVAGLSVTTLTPTVATTAYFTEV